MPEQTPAPATVSPRTLRRVGLAGACVAALVVAGGLISRVHADQQLKTWTEAQSIPIVSVVPVAGGGQQQLVLPANVEALNTAPIHARVSGYLKKWYVDIGSHVRAGQVLAEVDTPELDQQVLQAKADLATAEAAKALAETTARRWAGLVAQDAVSRQEADEKQGDLAVRLSAVNAAKANLNRLLAMSSFKRITAPFDGVVTSRQTDIGALISVGGPSDAALFTVADQHRLRVYVRVPQAQSSLVRPGMAAKVTAPEYPGQAFTAVVVKDAGAVDPQSGSVLVELQLDNPGDKLKSGEYAQVSFDLPSAPTAVSIPSTAILFRNGGPMVALVGQDGHVQLRPVVISRDLGPTVEVGHGVAAGERVVNNPPESLSQGDLVRIAQPRPAGAAHARS